MDVLVRGVGEALEGAARLKVALRVVLHGLVGLGLELPLQIAVNRGRRTERRKPGCQRITWLARRHDGRTDCAKRWRNTLTFEKTASACWYNANPVSMTCTMTAHHHHERSQRRRSAWAERCRGGDVEAAPFGKQPRVFNLFPII